MAARSFGSQFPTCFTAEQLSALEDRGIAASDIRPTTCSASLLNTCSRDAQELLDQYKIYDTEEGLLYTRWGNIASGWGESSGLSDSRWNTAKYERAYSYVEGDEVLRIENGGLRLVLYRANQDLPVPAGVFDPVYWDEICRISTGEIIGLPNIEDILSRYSYYRINSELTEWAEFAENWNKDLEGNSSDVWSRAKIAKDFFYKKSDVVLWDSRCGDNTCVYVAKTDIPVTEGIDPNSPPPSEFWEILYCVPNGRPNVCGKTFSCDKPNRAVVTLGSGDENLICVPVESQLDRATYGY